MPQRVNRKEREQFISLIAQNAQYEVGIQDVRSFAKRLMYYGATYGRIAEMACNSPDYPDYIWRLPKDQRQEAFRRVDKRWQDALDKNEQKAQRIEKKITEMCKAFGCVPVFQGDPRGATVKIKVPTGKTNDWGQEGICVPTS